MTAKKKTKPIDETTASYTGIYRSEWYPVFCIEKEDDLNELVLSTPIDIPAALVERWEANQKEFDAIQEELIKLWREDARMA